MSFRSTQDQHTLQKNPLHCLLAKNQFSGTVQCSMLILTMGNGILMYSGHVLTSWSNLINRNVMSMYSILLHLSLASGFEMPGKQFPLI